MAPAREGREHTRADKPVWLVWARDSCLRIHTPPPLSSTDLSECRQHGHGAVLGRRSRVQRRHATPLGDGQRGKKFQGLQSKQMKGVLRLGSPSSASNQSTQANSQVASIGNADGRACSAGHRREGLGGGLPR